MNVITNPDHDAALEQAYPSIPWREAIMMTVPETNVKTFGCRLCIGRFGIAGHEVANQPKTREAFDEHMAKVHPKAAT